MLSEFAAAPSSGLICLIADSFKRPAGLIEVELPSPELPPASRMRHEAAAVHRGTPANRSMASFHERLVSWVGS